MQGLFLLTMKPVTYAANVAEGDLGDQVFTRSSACMSICQQHWQAKLVADHARCSVCSWHSHHATPA